MYALILLLEYLIKDFDFKKGTEMPWGDMAWFIHKNHFLYLEVIGVPKYFQLKGISRNILFNINYSGIFTFTP